MDKSRESIFNPIGRAFNFCTTFVTGITEKCWAKTKEAVQVVIDNPVSTACITAAVVSMGASIINHPETSILTLVAINFILLNNKLKTKISNTLEACRNLVTFKVPGNLNFRSIDIIKKTENLQAAKKNITVNDSTSNELSVTQDQVKSSDNSSSLIKIPHLYLNFENLNGGRLILEENRLKLFFGKRQFYPEKPFIYCPSNYYPSRNPASSWINKKPPQTIKLGAIK